MRVALLGYYSYGNFGDDLMAVMFGSFLKARGHRVAVYGLPTDEATAFGLEAVTSVDELVDGSDALVYGGGGLFVRDPAADAPAGEEPRFGPQMKEYDSCIARAADLARARGVPVALVSVGGAGIAHRPRAATAGIIADARLVTVRNTSDLAVAGYTSARVLHFPDVVLGTSVVLPLAGRTPRSRKRIGVDVHIASDVVRASVDAVLTHVLGARADVDFVDVDPARADHPRRRSFFEGRLASCSDGYVFRAIREDVAFLAGLDAILSTRLHVGVTALSYGVPFVSIAGHTKTRTFLESASLSSYCFPEPLDVDRLQGLLLRLTLEAAPENATLAKLIDESRGHFEALDEWLSAIGTSPRS